MTNVYRWSIAIFPTCEEVEDPLEDHSQMLLLPNEEFEQIARSAILRTTASLLHFVNK